jgi:hypothetical protein
MACRCSSKKKERLTKQMQRRLFETEQFKIAMSMKGKNPSSLKDKTLLDYHKKTHMLYAGNVKRNPINKQFVNSIVDLHDQFVREMLNRGMKHNTPLKKV